MKSRLDQSLVTRGLVRTRSQAESYIKLGHVEVAGKLMFKPGFIVGDTTEIKLLAKEQYVSRAGLKLASVAEIFDLDFTDKTILDVGSSTGGFTDYALRRGAKKSIAVEVGSNQLHPSLRGDERIELHEQTDIRDCYLAESEEGKRAARDLDSFQARYETKNRKICLITGAIDIVVADVSFISLREILPSVRSLSNKKTDIIAMVKPQFEAGASNLKHNGVIKNDRMRRDILKDFEAWVQGRFVIINKADSGVAGEKGNVERFYHLKMITR